MDLNSSLTAFLDRNHVLAAVVKDLEWSIHSMSSTEMGYADRLATMTAHVKLLRRPEAWDDGDGYDDELEDVREIAGVIRSAASRKQKQYTTNFGQSFTSSPEFPPRLSSTDSPGGGTKGGPLL